MPLGSIGSGGTAQALVGANPFRNGLSVQNTSDGLLRLQQGGSDASATLGILVKAGGYYETPPSQKPVGSWSIWGPTDNQSFQWGEW